MSLSTFREARQAQLHYTNRALENRCRPLRHFEVWAREIRDRAGNLQTWRNRHEAAQGKSSLCFRDTLMDWYYSSGAKCVHEHEGAWTSNTGNGYFGGFQADLSFAASYGAEYYPPTPDQWTPLQQIHMAYRGWLARGWYPWPNTARMCGLL